MLKSIIAGTVTVATVGLAAVGGTAAQAWAETQPTGIGGACVDWQVDNCYTKAQMEDFLGVIDGFVLDYMQEIGVPQNALPEVVYVPTNKSVQTECQDGNGDQSADDEAYFYCPADNTVYIGQEALWGYYHDYGTAGPTAGLAHEYGHFLQTYTDVPSPESDAESIVHENQADCVSGAFFSYFNDQGNVDFDRDLQDLAGVSIEIASEEGPGRDHGTVEERRESFGIGYLGDLPACNSFYPDAPISA